MNRDGISQGLALIPSGVFILSAEHNSQRAAILASFIQQASFEPPLIVSAIGRGRPIAKMIQEAELFAVSVMSKDSKESLARFWKGIPEGTDPFENLPTSVYETGIPILKDALGFVECRLKQTLDTGDHLLCIGEIINGGRIMEGDPFVRLRKTGFDY